MGAVMKKIYYSLIACFLFQITAYSQEGWISQNSGTNSDLSSVFFLDSNNGWAAGRYGTLLRTTNGGIDWIIQNSGTNAWLKSIYFIDQNKGWIVGSEFNVTSSIGIILKTTNGGMNWNLDTTDFLLSKIFFIDHNVGWAIGSNNEIWPNYHGIILKTTDGGETWNQQYEGAATSIFSDFCFTNENDGWVIGYLNPSPLGIMLRTTDGGLNWVNVPNSHIALAAIFFIDENYGWLAGEDEFLRTTNGGENWFNLYGGSFSNVSDMYFADQYNGWITTWGGEISHTTDGGTNWSAQSSNTTGQLTSIYFINNEEGWIVGEDGTILHTTNGGGYIDLLLPNGGESISRNSLYDVTWSSNNVNSVDIYFSLDDGLSWSNIISGYTYSGGYGQYLWTVPDTNSNQCLIKIESSLNLLVFDISDQNFQITDSPKFSYFPLSVGNTWYFSEGNDGVIKQKIEVEKDTILDDNHSYAKLNYVRTSDNSLIYVYYLRQENNKIVRYPNYTILDFDINVGDTVWSFLGIQSSPAILDTIYLQNVFGRYLSTYYFFTTPFDYYSYSDSIGFNTLWALTLLNYYPKYLLGCIIDGVSYGLVGVEEDENEFLPVAFNLSQNYPNPFNPATTITYQIPEREFVTIKVYDILGREVATLVNEEKPAGSYEIQFNASGLTSGIYFYQLKAGSYSETKKMILLK